MRLHRPLAQTRRADNARWHHKNVLAIPPFDTEDRGINGGNWVSIASRACADVMTSDKGGWATNCPSTS